MAAVSNYWKRKACIATALTAAAMLTGCGSMMESVSSTRSSISSRFGQLFGSNSQEATTAAGASTQATDNSDLSCPSVAIRAGASTLAIGLPGKPASGSDLRYQGVITRTARDCTLRDGQIIVRLGVQGRVIVGPAGAPPNVDVPIRVAVVYETSGGEKVVFTKPYRTSVAMEPGAVNAEYSIVAEDIVYPVPSAAASDSYTFYVGFDPGALKPEPARRKKK